MGHSVRAPTDSLCTRKKAARMRAEREERETREDTSSTCKVVCDDVGRTGRSRLLRETAVRAAVGAAPQHSGDM